MGFGILFIGYILAFLMKIIPYGYIFELTGILLMIYAFTKLSEYHKYFKYAFIASVAMLLPTIYNLLIMFGVAALNNEFYKSAFPAIKTIIDAAFHASLYLSIASIAKETGVTKIQTASYRNMIFYGLFFSLQIISSVIKFEDNVAVVIGMCGNALWLGWLILNSIMIFSAYKNICDENDEDMAVKPSRFAFINDLRAEYDRREQKARKEDFEYIRNKKEKRKNKKKSKK